MSAQHEFASLLLARRPERPLQAILRNLFYGFAIAAGLALYDAILWRFQPWGGFGYLFVGVVLAFTGWGAERLWFEMILPIVRFPFTWYAYLTRIPLIYFSGAIGYTFGLLLAKRWGLMEVQDLPVRELFESGGKIGLLIQVPLQFAYYRTLKKQDASLEPLEKRSE